MEEAEYICGECDSIIENGNGFIYVEDEEVHEARKVLQESKPEDGIFLTEDMAELIESTARWKAVHHDCSEDDLSTRYYIDDVKRMRTPDQALYWMCRMVTKDWVVSLTDWVEFIERHFETAEAESES